MTDTLLTVQPEVPDNVSGLTAGEPKFERLDAQAALQACDGHASQGVNAIVVMILPSGGSVLLCGNCARRAGFEHTATAPKENRQQGSAH